MSIGKSIRIYHADATITGIRYAEIVNWTGQALVCPRNRLGELKDWPETNKLGVYLLFETHYGESKPLVYIGESVNVTKRLTTHDRLKDFWNEVVIFTSKDQNLTKTHVKFLESSLLALAKYADRCKIENEKTPSEVNLPRADRDAMAEFIENIRMVIGTLGYPILEPLLRPAAMQVEVSPMLQSIQNEVDIDCSFSVHNLKAHGTRTDEGFVLRKDSQMSRTNTESATPRVGKFKEQLVVDGRLIVEGDHLLLTEDILVSSPSLAAALVAGTSRNGPLSWIAADGRSLKDIEDAAVETLEGSS